MNLMLETDPKLAPNRPAKMAITPEYAQPRTKQLSMLLERDFKEYWRTPEYSFARWMLTGLFAFLQGLIFLQQELLESADVQGRVSLINLMLTILGQYNIFVVVPFIFQRKALFYREKASAMYDPMMFAVSGGIVEVPYVFIESLICVNLVYWMVGFGPDGGDTSDAWWVFLYYWLISFTFTMCFTNLGIFFTYISPNAAAAALLSALFTQVLGLFAGVSVPGANIPDFLIWLSYLTPLRWATEGQVASQFNFIFNEVCVPFGEIMTVAINQTLGTVSSGCLAVEGSNTTQKCCYDSGSASGALMTAKDYVLGDPKAAFPDTGFLGGKNGYSYDFILYDFIYLAAITAVVRAITFYAARNLSFQMR